MDDDFEALFNGSEEDVSVEADLKDPDASLRSGGSAGGHNPRKRPAEDALEPDVTKLTTNVWTLKIPKWLSDRWAELEQEDVDLGEIRFHAPLDAASKPDASLILSDEAVNKGLPREYRLNVLEASRKSLYAFAERADGTVEINGTITTEVEAQAVMCEELRQILEKREQEQMTRKAPILLSNQEMKPNAIVPGAQTLSLPLARKPPTKQQILDSKTARMPKNELLDLLFSAFERYHLWTFKGIVEYVRQPISYTREVLQEIAFVHKKGEHTGKYELKPEFRRGDGAGAASPAGSSAPDAQEPGAAEEGDEDLAGESAAEEGMEEVGEEEEESADDDEFEEVE